MIGLMFSLVKDKKAAANVTAIDPAYTVVISFKVSEWNSSTLANTMMAKNDVTSVAYDAFAISEVASVDCNSFSL